MPANYAAWPTEANVIDRCTIAGVDVMARPVMSHVQQTIDAVSEEVRRLTRRQFVADTVDGIRYFDGSGTPEQEVDEFVSLTTVQIIGWAGLISPMTIAAAVAATDQTLPQWRILLYRGSAPVVQGYYIDRFPAGRQNIAVTAKWGYATTIPADLWQAVEGESARRLCWEAIQTEDGRLKQLNTGEDMFSYELMSMDDGSLFAVTFGKVVYQYMRPAGRRLRRWKAPML